MSVRKVIKNSCIDHSRHVTLVDWLLFLNQARTGCMLVQDWFLVITFIAGMYVCVCVCVSVRPRDHK